MNAKLCKKIRKAIKNELPHLTQVAYKPLRPTPGFLGKLVLDANCARAIFKRAKKEHKNGSAVLA